GAAAAAERPARGPSLASPGAAGNAIEPVSHWGTDPSPRGGSDTLRPGDAHAQLPVAGGTPRDLWSGHGHARRSNLYSLAERHHSDAGQCAVQSNAAGDRADGAQDWQFVAAAS